MRLPPSLLIRGDIGWRWELGFGGYREGDESPK